MPHSHCSDTCWSSRLLNTPFPPAGTTISGNESYDRQTLTGKAFPQSLSLGRHYSSFNEQPRKAEVASSTNRWLLGCPRIIKISLRNIRSPLDMLYIIIYKFKARNLSWYAGSWGRVLVLWSSVELSQLYFCPSQDWRTKLDVYLKMRHD